MLSKLKGQHVRLRPMYLNLDTKSGAELPSTDWSWFVHEAGRQGVYIRNSVSANCLRLGADQIREFLTDPSKHSYGFLILKGQAWVCGRYAGVDPIVASATLTGDAWWLACDLHSIKLQAQRDDLAKMREAIVKSQEHANKLGSDSYVLSRLRMLGKTYERKTAITEADKKPIQEQVDAILDYCGKSAERNQRNYKP
jgi:hypothetical protein